jgi:hypothetical protein
MPYFKVKLSGAGISLPFDGGDPAIGFFTTRLVRARDEAHAHGLAQDLVLSEWHTGGAYATGNIGALPTLLVEESWQVGLLQGILGRRPTGYSFYAHDD